MKGGYTGFTLSVYYPDLSGNIPERPAYGIYISQVIRYAKICNQTKDFIDRIRLLFNKLRKKHFSKERLLAALKKCCRKNPWIMVKHHHGMNNHLANDCWGADTWSWYRDSSPETSVSVHGQYIHIPPPVLIQLVTRYLVNLVIRIKEPSRPTGWQQSPQLQAEENQEVSEAGLCHNWLHLRWCSQFHCRCPSVRLWTESCPLCIFNNTHRIHFIFAHLIKQLQKVCRV